MSTSLAPLGIPWNPLESLWNPLEIFLSQDILEIARKAGQDAEADGVSGWADLSRS